MSTVNRREFLEIAGAGLLIVAAAPLADAQRGGGARGAGNPENRLHIGEDGFITVLRGKIEEGQGEPQGVSGDRRRGSADCGGGAFGGCPEGRGRSPETPCG